MRSFRIAGVVVLFYPDNGLEDRINSYLDQLEILYVIDNSEMPARNTLGSLASHPKIKYIHNQENLGIAQALNEAANFAMNFNCDFLLTMDQDSSFQMDQFTTFLSYLHEIDLETVGILSPVHIHPMADLHHSKIEFVNVKHTMTSGNLLNLQIFKEAGDFFSPLFIDHVDHEYCLRLRSMGYKVLVAQNITLHHSLGVVSKFSILSYTIFKFVSHQPVRSYYMIRNGLYVARKYKHFFPEFHRQNMIFVAKEIIKTLFEREKFKRIKFILLALKHYRSSKLGKFSIH